MARASGGRGPGRFSPNPGDGAETSGQPLAMFVAPKGVDRYHSSTRVDAQYAVKIRNLMFDDGVLASRRGTDLMGGEAASTVMQVVDFVRQGTKKVTIRFCLRHVEIFEYGSGTWRSFAVPLTGSERDMFAYTGWADKLLFSNGVDGLWELDFKTLEIKLVPGAPSAKHLTTFGNRVVASATTETGEFFPLRVRWSQKNDYTKWTGQGSGFEDFYGSPGGITDEVMGVFPFSDETAWVVRSRSVWQLSVSGNALAPFRTSRILANVGSPFRWTIAEVSSGIVFVSRDNVHLLTASGTHQLIGDFVFDEIVEEIETLRNAYAAYDVGRREYRLAGDTLVYRYRFQEEGWTTDEYPFPIRSMSRQVQGKSGIPVDMLPGTVDELSAMFPPGAVDDLVYQREDDDSMMFVPWSTVLTVRENEGTHDTLLTGEDTESEILLESGVVNPDPMEAVELHEIHMEYESQMDQGLLFEASFDDGASYQPLSGPKDIEATDGSEIVFVKVERVSRKLQLRLRSAILGKLRILGLAPVLVKVKRLMTTKKPKVADILILPSPLSLRVGDTQQLSVTLLGPGGQAISGKHVTLVSSNRSVATVSGTGVVRGIAEGSFAIVASVGNVQVSVSGTVQAAAVAGVALVTVTPSISQGAVGSQQQFTATLRDANGNILVGRQITWASSDTEFATVNTNGLVTLVAEGGAVISAVAEGVTGVATLTVTAVADVVASVDVTPDPFSGVAGSGVQLQALPKDAGGNVLSGKAITWTSSAPAVATVNATGFVTFASAGAVVITATCETISGTANGTITAAVVPVATVTVTPGSFSKAPGQTQALVAVTKDGSGNVLAGRLVVWSSSNTSVATVDASGVVTAVTTGTAIITASSEGKTGSSNATVTAAPVATVSVAPSSFNLQPGAQTQLSATLRDAANNVVSGRVITWGSSNISVATVSSSGLVTAVSNGVVTITATSEGKLGSSSGVIGVASYSPVNSPSTVRYIPEPNSPNSKVVLPTTFDSQYDPDGVALSFASTVTLLPSGNPTQDATSLTNAINAAATRSGHSLILLGDNFQGVVSNSILLRKHLLGNYRTYVVASSANTYAAEGVRVNTSLMATAPKIVTNTVAPAVLANNGANGYRFVGVEITATPQSSTVGYNYGLVRLGEDETSISDQPDDIIFDRCYIHGGPVQCQNGVILNCRKAAVINCNVSGIRWTGVESHAIVGWAGTGPYKIVDNYTEAASINILFGGADPAIPGVNPSDIEIRRNHLFKDLSLLGQGYSFKNLLELKTGYRVLIEGNVVQHSRAEGQEGFGIIIQSLSDTDTAETRDVTIRYNKVSDVNVGISTAAHGFNGSGVALSRVEIAHNLLTDIGGDSTNRGFPLFGELFHVRILHNTLVRNTVPNGIPIITEAVDGLQAATELIIRDNILGSGNPYSTVFMSGGATGTNALNQFAADYEFSHNVGWDDVVGAGAYPATNQFAANLAAVGFVDEPGGDYHLSGSSPYKNTASDGTDPGADIDKVNLATSGVVV